MVFSSLSLRQSLMASLCASALVMGACSSGDKVPAEEIKVEAASLGLTSADESALSQHFVIENRSGTEDETLALLDALNIEPTAYGERTINGSTVIYTDWSASNDDGAVTASTVQLIGFHETEDGPGLDKLVVETMGIKGTEEDDDGTRRDVVDASVDGLVVVEPSPALLADLADILMARDEGRDAVNEIAGDQQFRALQIEGMTANVSDTDGSGKLSVAQVIVGNDAETETLDAVLETVNFDWNSADSAEPVKVEMDGVTILGLDISATQSAAGPQMPGFGGIYANMLGPKGMMPYRQIDLGKMSINSAMFDLTTDGFEADTEVKGSKTIMRSVLSPMVVNLKDAGTTPLAPYMDVLRENGLAELTLKGSSTTEVDSKTDRLVVTDGLLDVDDGLRLKCDYALQGMLAAAKTLEESGVKPPVLDITDQETAEADFETYMADMQAYNAAQAEANEQIKIESLACDVQDVPGNSLVERGYAVASAITGRPVAVLKGGAKTMIALGSMTARTEFERDIMDIVGTGLIDFIDTPGQTMSIVMAPETPVSLTSLTGVNGTPPSIKPLGLTVEVK